MMTHSRAEQSRAEQSRAEQSRAEQSRAEQSTAQHSTAQHSTAQHSSPHRDSNIELLRIIAMVMIAGSHFCHGVYHWSVADLSIPHLWIAVLGLFGKIGVNVFVLISGYYLIEAKGLFAKPAKIVKYLGQLYFYSIGIFFAKLFLCYALPVLVQGRHFRWQYPILFPVLTNLWWFASIYFWMFLFHGFLNLLLQNLEQKEYQKFIILLLVCFCLFPTILHKSYHTELLWFIILYAIAGYIRKFGLLFPFFKRGGIFLLMGIVLLSISAGLRIAGIAVEKSLPLLASHTISLAEMHNVFTFLISLFLFSAFLQFKIRYNRWINLLASATFGIYLIHDHPAVRHFLWQMLFKNHLFQNSPAIIPYSIIAVCCVYLLCTVIDLLRQYLFERPFLTLIKKYDDRGTALIGKSVSRICNVVFGHFPSR